LIEIKDNDGLIGDFVQYDIESGHDIQRDVSFVNRELNDITLNFRVTGDASNVLRVPDSLVVPSGSESTIPLKINATKPGIYEGINYYWNDWLFISALHDL